jgi:chromatin remodeling complex protein RSC6
MPTPKKAATPKNALSKPVQPDAALAAVVGKEPLPRTELTKRLWEYIRKHDQARYSAELGLMYRFILGLFAATN